MSALHIVTATIAPNATQSVAPAEESAETTPFTALLGEQMQAHAHLPAHLLSQAAEKHEHKQAEADDTELPVADAIVLPAALTADARPDELPTRLTGPRGATEALRAEVTTHDGRNSRSAQRGQPTATTSTPIAADTATETAGATARVAATFELPAAAQTEAPNPTGAAQALTATQVVERPAATTPIHTLQQPVGSARWAGELGQTVQILIRAEQQSATLHVTPADLGPIEVQIDLSGDQANLSFTVQHPDTRNVLENALSRLRDMLAEGGIALGDAHVNQQSAEQREASGQTQHSGSGGSTITSGAVTETVAVRARVGLVDTFA